MSMYATIADVEFMLGRTLTIYEHPHVNSLITLASALVDSETNQYAFEVGSHTVGRVVRNCRVMLSGKVASVDEVRVINKSDGSATVLVLDDDYTVRGREVFFCSGSNYFAEVDFTVDAPIPDDIVSLVAGVVSSTLSDPMLAAANAMAGAYPVSKVTSSGKVWLSGAEKAILKKYKQPRASLDIVG